MKTDAQEEFWTTYYADVAKAGTTWLDYSNERVQAQIFGLALEAAGPIPHRRCLDVGCGWGLFSAALSALGATSVTGVDIVPEMISHHQRTYPSIRWLCGGLMTLDREGELGECDIALMLEVLQYLPFPSGLRTLWDRIAPGGRLVVVVPNANCPIVTRTRARFGDTYAPPPIVDLDEELSGWRDLEQIAYRGLTFGTDQRLAPYSVSEWRRRPGGWETEPNRIQFVAIKRAAGTEQAEADA